MSIYYGDDAISYLAKKSTKKDTQSSSHWRNYHADFNFKGGKFSGIKGFGSYENQYTGFKKVAHFLFQAPFRKIAKQFSSFDTVNRVAKEILSKQNKGYSLDVLRQVIVLSYLNDKKAVKHAGVSCVIGDGFGTMTSLLLKNNEQSVILVNLSKTLLVDLWYLKLLLKDEFATDVIMVSDKDGMNEALLKIKDKPVVIAIEAENHQLMQLCPIDLTINIASMQEMNPVVVSEYFTNISIAAKGNSSLFYCCNRENKVLPDGTVVNFDKYPWSMENQILDDELCPWHLKYYNTKPPFYHDYDGPIRHRLAQFS